MKMTNKINNLSRKGFVEFKHVDVSKGEACLLEKLGNGVGRAEQKLVLGVL